MQGFFDVDACFGYLNDKVLPSSVYRSQKPPSGVSKKYTQEQRDEAIRLHESGMSAAKIGAQLGIPPRTITSFINFKRTYGRTNQGN